MGELPSLSSCLPSFSFSVSNIDHLNGGQSLIQTAAPFTAFSWAAGNAAPCFSFAPDGSELPLCRTQLKTKGFQYVYMQRPAEQLASATSGRTTCALGGQNEIHAWRDQKPEKARRERQIQRPSAAENEEAGKWHSGKPTFLRRVFRRVSPRSNANSGLFSEAQSNGSGAGQLFQPLYRVLPVAGIPTDS